MTKGIWIFTFFLLAAGATSAQDLSAANVSNYLGNSTWTWTIFLTGSKEVLNTVRYVEYTLHPTFSNPIQRADRGSDPRYPFGLTATGWGVFEVRIKVVFKNDQVRYMTHMLQFVPATSQSICGASLKLINRHPLTLPDPRFKDAVYLYVDEIHDDWNKRPPNLTIFYGYFATWRKDQNGQYVYVSPGDFKSQTKYVPPETKWSLKIQHEGDAIQFRYDAGYYLISVIKVAIKQRPFNYLEVQVCDRAPLSAK